MQFRTFAAAAAVLLSAIGSVSADGYLPVSYPFECANYCGPLVTYSQSPEQCEGDTLKCFCTQKHADKLIRLCDACVYNAKDSKLGKPFYPKIQAVLKACDLKTTSITQGAAAATAAPILGAGAMAAIAAVVAL